MLAKGICKGLGNYFFADILCLFVALTLSPFSSKLFRLISAICTFAVMICLCINYGVNRGREDMRQRGKTTAMNGFWYSLSASILFIGLGVTLILAKAGVVAPGFYRWYKLLDAPFLQTCNLCSADITTNALSWGKTIFLAGLNLIPFPVVWCTYILTKRGFDPEELQYR